MAVVVKRIDGTDEPFTDSPGEHERAYRVQDGTLFIMNKPEGKPWMVLWEYSAAGYIRVQGKRYGGEIKNQDGTDGKVRFEGGKMYAF